MKNQQKGFAIPILIAIIVLAVGGFYAYYKYSPSSAPVISIISTTTPTGDGTLPNAAFNKNPELNQGTTTALTSNGISDETILSVKNGIDYENDQKFKPDGKGNYTMSLSEDGLFSFTIKAKGDVNGDGYEDAILAESYCAASCGNNLSVIANDKNGKGHVLTSSFPGYITSGAGQTGLTSVSIKDGVISVTATGFEGTNASNGEYGKVETRYFKLSDYKLIRTDSNGQALTDSWKTYLDSKLGFSIKYPEYAKINNSTLSGGLVVTLDVGSGQIMIEVVNQAWRGGVLSSPGDCDDTSTPAEEIHTNINGTMFSVLDMSREMSGMNSPTSATEFCSIKGDTAYKVIARMPYNPPYPDVSQNSVLNDMINSFIIIK